MKNISVLKLYFIFLKIGAILLGGGYVILPILKSELCDKRGMVSETELVDYFALSQSLPGIVAANISMFLGYNLCGKRGAAAAMLGIITVPFICIIILAAIFESLVGNSFVNGIFWGVGVAVIALILLTIREIWQKCNRNLFFYIIFLTALVALLVFKHSPIDVIIAVSIFGVLIKRIFKGRREI